MEYDRPELITGNPAIHEPHILDGFQTATLSTSDRAILDPVERKEISLNADLIDMEGASVVQACRIFETRCYLFKFVSDTPDHTEDSDVIKNIKLYRTPFYGFFQSSVIPVLLDGLALMG
jgi:nucleoside phosphorylase